MGIAQFDARKVARMSATRKLYFEGVGVDITNEHSLETAINVSGLNYEVAKAPIFFQTETEDGFPKLVQYDKMFTTYRTDTMKPLGVVGEKYQILQNRDAFDFLDSLIFDGEAKFETAGTFGDNGSKSFITISTDAIKILDDDIMPYILLTNSFDGSGSVKAMFTSVRVFCSNCLLRASRNSINSISIRHSTNLHVRMEQAKELLMANTHYLEELKKQSEKLAVTPFSEEAFQALARELFPINEEQSATINNNNLMLLEQLLTAYKQDDLQNFNNTAYKVVQAVSDFESHKQVLRQTKTSDLAGMKVVMAGMPLLNKIWDRMDKIAA